MKKLVYLILFMGFGISAQDFNQFDTNGKRHGAWKKNFEGTEVIRYQGQFNHGKEVGEFKFYKNIDDKPVLTATKKFNNNNNIAEVKFLSSAGKVISEGKMRGKIYIGEWKYYHKKNKGLMTLESYNDQGELNGLKKVYYRNGQLAEERTYVNGALEGESKWYSEKGNVLKIHLYSDNALNGLAKHYDAVGNLSVEGLYKNDKKHGIWKYYEKGELVREQDFTRKSKNPYKKQK